MFLQLFLLTCLLLDMDSFRHKCRTNKLRNNCSFADTHKKWMHANELAAAGSKSSHGSGAATSGIARQRRHWLPAWQRCRCRLLHPLPRSMYHLCCVMLALGISQGLSIYIYLQLCSLFSVLFLCVWRPRTFIHWWKKANTSRRGLSAGPFECRMYEIDLNVELWEHSAQLPKTRESLAHLPFTLFSEISVRCWVLRCSTHTCTYLCIFDYYIMATFRFSVVFFFCSLLLYLHVSLSHCAHVPSAYVLWYVVRRSASHEHRTIFRIDQLLPIYGSICMQPRVE